MVDKKRERDCFQFLILSFRCDKNQSRFNKFKRKSQIKIIRNVRERSFVLRPNNASTCCPIGFDHTDVDDDDDDDDEPLERGGKSGGIMLPLLLSIAAPVAPPAAEFDVCADRFD